MADKKEVKRGDWIRGRRAWYDSHEDEHEDEGVVIGLPRSGHKYYDVVNPYDDADSGRIGDQQKPFQIHDDDTVVVVPPEELEGDEERAFQKKIQKHYGMDSA